MNRKETMGMMKIGEIAKAANTSISTVKYYVTQGLIDIAFKTSANMAYYHPSSVQRILLIKKLQKEKFYPLSVIKKLLEQSDQTNMEIELMDAIHKVSSSDVQISVPLSSAPRETGLSRKQINELIRSNIISSVQADRKKVFTESSMKIMELVKRRIDGGMPFEQTVESFGIYERELRRAAEGDIDAMIARTLLRGEYSTYDMAQLIRLSDVTLDEFIKLKRDQLNRHFGSRRVEELMRFLDNIGDFLFACLIPAIGVLDETASFIRLCALIGKNDYDTALELSSREKDPLLLWAFQTIILLKKNCNEDNPPMPANNDEDVFANAVASINSLLRLGKRAGLAVIIPICSRCKEFFTALEPQRGRDACYKLFLYYIRLAFLYLAPPVLGCGEECSAAMGSAPGFSRSCIKDHAAAEAFTASMLNKLNSYGSRS